MLPDRSVLIGQKLVENAKIKLRLLSNFQTMCLVYKCADWTKEVESFPSIFQDAAVEERSDFRHQNVYLTN